MNAVCVALLAAAATLPACSAAEDPLDPRCPAASRLVPSDPADPARCVVTVTCKDAVVLALRCTTSGPDGGTTTLACECFENDVAGRSVEYSDAFCGPVDEGGEAAAAEASRKAMAAACGFDVD